MPEENFFWAEKVAGEIAGQRKAKYVCEGGWSPSGYFHIGNFRPEIFTPYAVLLELEKIGLKASQILIVDDFDPIDKIPAGIPVPKEKENDFIGVPQALAASPFKGYRSWAAYFESQVTDVIDDFGVKVKFASSFKSYKSGERNDLIKFALNNAEAIVRVWNRVAGTDKPLSFLPVAMLCEKCGKIMFTEALSWDSKKVSYKCKSCGFEGNAPPFDGRAKLHWRVHWVANWVLNDVAFESGGKDHLSKGGSVDVGKALAIEVFNRQPPYLLPTEFVQLKGTKMSGSAGNVFGLKEWLGVASPELFRFMFFSYKANSAIDFNLADNSFLLLNDRFERAERVFYGKEKAENEKIEAKLKTAYALSIIGKPAKEMPLQVSYSFAVQLAQLMDLKKPDEIVNLLLKTGHAEKALSKEEKKRLLANLRLAKNWVEKYAPAEFKVSFLERLSEGQTSAMDMPARKLLHSLAASLEKENSAEDLQQAIYEAAKSSGVQPKLVFKAIYLALTGKEAGPRAGLLILAFGKERCLKRLKEAAA